MAKGSELLLVLKNILHIVKFELLLLDQHNFYLSWPKSRCPSHRLMFNIILYLDCHIILFD